MPSGISHILLSRYLPIEEGSPYQSKQRANARYLQIGSLAPDLSYASIIDDNFLENQSDLADLFHFTAKQQDTAMSPSKLALLGLTEVKNSLQQGAGKRECDALFWFLAGYTSHVIADGICHPYVMDKVDRYEGSNKADHRALEMGMDVLLLKQFTAPTGHSIEASYAGMDTFIKDFMNLRYANFVLDHFAGLIEDVYAYRSVRI